MKDLKISSRYDNHICTLENGEKAILRRGYIILI